MYRAVLFGHAYLRWFVLLVALVVLVRTFLGWRGRREWLPADEKLHVALVAGVDLQFLLGLILYVLSPITRAFLSDAGTAMKDPILRFFGVEHLVGMLIAVTLFHIGRAVSKKAAGAARHKKVFTFTLAAAVVAFLAIPWPSRPYGRPLFRGFASAEVTAPAVPEGIELSRTFEVRPVS
jgi:hypothetical protein